MQKIKKIAEPQSSVKFEKSYFGLFCPKNFDKIFLTF